MLSGLLIKEILPTTPPTRHSQVEVKEHSNGIVKSDKIPKKERNKDVMRGSSPLRDEIKSSKVSKTVTSVGSSDRTLITHVKFSKVIYHIANM